MTTHQKLNLAELERLESLFKRFGSYAFVGEANQLQVRAAIIAERRRLNLDVIRLNPTFDFFNNESKTK